MSNIFQPSDYSGLLDDAWAETQKALGIYVQEGATGGSCLDPSNPDGPRIPCADVKGAMTGEDTTAYVPDTGTISDYDITEEVADALANIIPASAPDWMKTDKRVKEEEDERKRKERNQKIALAGAVGGGVLVLALLFKLTRPKAAPAAAPPPPAA